MRVGDVLLGPVEGKVHVVWELLGTDCRTLPVAKRELLQWVETPEDQHEDWTIALERHSVAVVKRWVVADDGLRAWALRFAFADPHVCVMPAVAS